MSFLQINREREREAALRVQHLVRWQKRKNRQAICSSSCCNNRLCCCLPLPANCSNCQCRPANWNTEVTTTTRSQPASSKRNKKIIYDLSENLQSKIAIKHSELHSVLDVLLSLPDLLLLLLLLSSFLFFSFIDGSIWLTIIRLMMPMISRNTFLFFCLSFFHTQRVWKKKSE